MLESLHPLLSFLYGLSSHMVSAADGDCLRDEGHPLCRDPERGCNVDEILRVSRSAFPFPYGASNDEPGEVL